jgi:hypothetical protein
VKVNSQDAKAAKDLAFHAHGCAPAHERPLREYKYAASDSIAKTTSSRNLHPLRQVVENDASDDV